MKNSVFARYLIRFRASYETLREVRDIFIQVVSGSRDKTAMVWELTPSNEDGRPGYARRCLHGHNQAICDTVSSY